MYVSYSCRSYVQVCVCMFIVFVYSPLHASIIVHTYFWPTYIILYLSENIHFCSMIVYLINSFCMSAYSLYCFIFFETKLLYQMHIKVESLDVKSCLPCLLAFLLYHFLSLNCLTYKCSLYDSVSFSFQLFCDFKLDSIKFILIFSQPIFFF